MRDVRSSFRGAAALALAWSLAACAAQDRAGLDSVNEGIPLWAVSDGQNTIHLLGSVDLFRSDLYPLDAAIDAALEAADVVAFPLSLEQAIEAVSMSLSRGLLPPGETLPERIPDDLFQGFRHDLATVPLSPHMYTDMKPWLVATMLRSLAVELVGVTRIMSIEGHAAERARQADKRIVGLDRAEEHVDALDSLSDDAQVALLRRTLADVDSSTVRLERIASLWRQGDVAGIAATVSRAVTATPELAERLIQDRNERWVPRIEALLHEGEPAIVVVGLEHLVGPGSLVERLRERGHDVRQVEPARGDDGPDASA